MSRPIPKGAKHERTFNINSQCDKTDGLLTSEAPKIDFRLIVHITPFVLLHQLRCALSTILGIRSWKKHIEEQA